MADSQMLPPEQRLANDKFARETGITILKMEPGYAETEMTLEERHMNGEGVAHGGALFTMADYTFAAASNSYGPRAVSMDGYIQYHKPGFLGHTLIAIAKEVSRGKTVGRYTIEIRDKDGDTLIATMSGTVFIKN